ncbi:MAG: hypothetical protein JNL01_11880 [Bdellovibrionales bacterium]|nr:hypothetical protein [Bdellovibrionales bacterium]
MNLKNIGLSLSVAFFTSTAFAQTLVPVGDGNAIGIKNTQISLRSQTYRTYHEMNRSDLDSAWSAWSRREKICLTEPKPQKAENFDCAGVLKNTKIIRKVFKNKYKVKKP